MNCTPRAADDCGWRKYPTSTKFCRMDDVSPDFYAEADVAEVLMNHDVDTFQYKIHEAVMNVLIYGEGVINV